MKYLVNKYTIGLLTFGFFLLVVNLYYLNQSEVNVVYSGSIEVQNFYSITNEKDSLVIDIRTPEEYSIGHLPGAINIDYQNSDFLENLSELDKKGNYAIYCRIGTRSADALLIMQEMGFENVVELSGGIEAWARGGHTVCLAC